MAGMAPRVQRDGVPATRFEATVALARGTMEALDAWAADGMAFEMHADGELRAYLDADRAEARGMPASPHFERAGFEPAVAHRRRGPRAGPAELADAIVGAIRFPERTPRPARGDAGDSARGTRLDDLGVATRSRRSDGRLGDVPSGGVELAGRLRNRARPTPTVIAAGAWSPQVARLFARLPADPTGQGLQHRLRAGATCDALARLCSRRRTAP